MGARGDLRGAEWMVLHGFPSFSFTVDRGYYTVDVRFDAREIFGRKKVDSRVGGVRNREATQAPLFLMYLPPACRRLFGWPKDEDECQGAKDAKGRKKMELRHRGHRGHGEGFELEKCGACLGCLLGNNGHGRV